MAVVVTVPPEDAKPGDKCNARDCDGKLRYAEHSGAYYLECGLHPDIHYRPVLTKAERDEAIEKTGR